MTRFTRTEALHIDSRGITRDKRDPNPRHCIGYRIETEYDVQPTAAFPFSRSSASSETIYARYEDAEADMEARPSSKPNARSYVREVATNVDSLRFGRLSKTESMTSAYNAVADARRAA
ncbi:hypothetical protein [Qipengyuania atrilutea]|uniref:Uncharacterized protein n=1 Tax=Qipengyuania atrilutea TaxID=2744473 RepID=A0A850H2C7_9SPHN|nr:hypothetical protein [Actirhodobacter atriluteus]NVD44362.1 hypothetical protein [Actirhodobacter atriluteus]